MNLSELNKLREEKNRTTKSKLISLTLQNMLNQINLHNKLESITTEDELDLLIPRKAD